MHLESLSDADLVHRAVAGSADAFGALVSRHQDYVYNSVVHLVGSDEEADDVAQDVFVKAYGSLSSFKERSQFKTWLYGIMLNTVRSLWRRRSRSKLVSLEASRTGEEGGRHNPSSPEDGPVELAARAERIRAVKDAIGRLDEGLKEIIVLRDIEQLSYEELAEVLEVPLGTVKSRLFKARSSLKGKLEHLFGSELLDV